MLRPEPELAADAVDLRARLQTISTAAASRQLMQVSEESVTVGQMIEYLRRRFALRDRPIRLKKILHNVIHGTTGLHFSGDSRIGAAALILLRQERLFGEIILKKHELFDTVLGEAPHFATIGISETVR